jgi:hypothetical protein
MIGASAGAYRQEGKNGIGREPKLDTSSLGKLPPGGQPSGDFSRLARTYPMTSLAASCLHQRMILPLDPLLYGLGHREFIGQAVVDDAVVESLLGTVGADDGEGGAACAVADPTLLDNRAVLELEAAVLAEHLAQALDLWPSLAGTGDEAGVGWFDQVL